MKCSRKGMIAIALLAGCCSVHAAGGGGGGGAGGGDEISGAKSADPIIQSARDAIAKEDWDAAQATLQNGLVANSNNADYHNLYAYSIRKSPKPSMEVVFTHYAEALRIDPRHRGAHEYLGEAYLQIGNLAKAKEQLAALDKLCFFGCEEYDDLKHSIAAFESAQPLKSAQLKTPSW